MKNYIALWPDKTFSVVSASSITDLFWTLDYEGNPFVAKVYRLANKFAVCGPQSCVENGKMWPPEIIGKKERVKFDLKKVYSRCAEGIFH